MFQDIAQPGEPMPKRPDDADAERPAPDVAGFLKSWSPAVITLLANIIMATWYMSSQHADIVAIQSDLQGIHDTMRQNNLVFRVQTLEDAHRADTATMQDLRTQAQENNAAVNQQIKDLSSSINSQGQTLATISARLDFVIDRMYPEAQAPKAK